VALAHLGETYASTGDLRGAREAWDAIPGEEAAPDVGAAWVGYFL